VRNEFVFLFNTSWKSQFSTWRKAPLVPISLFSYIGKTNVSLERKFHLVRWLSVSIEVAFERESSFQLLQGRYRLGLIEIGWFSCVEDAHVSLEGKPTMLEAAACSTFFP
jgi:hypothetical protein